MATPQEMIAILQEAMDTIADYAGLLRRGATDLGAGDRSDNLMDGLRSTEPRDISKNIEKLRETAEYIDAFLKQMRGYLAQGNVAHVRSALASSAYNLGRILEIELWEGAPQEARIPPAYRIFQSFENELEEAFPYDGGDIPTPEVRMLTAYLQVYDNPWQEGV